MNCIVFKHIATGTSSNFFTAAAIGGAVGGAVILILLFLLCFVIRHAIRANKKKRRRRYSSIHRAFSMESSSSTMSGPHYGYVAELVNMKTSRSMSVEQAQTSKKLCT